MKQRYGRHKKCYNKKHEITGKIVPVLENSSWCDAPKHTKCQYRQRLKDGTHICELTADC